MTANEEILRVLHAQKTFMFIRINIILLMGDG
jgi:hypothetical protein